MASSSSGGNPQASALIIFGSPLSEVQKDLAARLAAHALAAWRTDVDVNTQLLNLLNENPQPTQHGGQNVLSRSGDAFSLAVVQDGTWQQVQLAVDRLASDGSTSKLIAFAGVCLAGSGNWFLYDAEYRPRSLAKSFKLNDHGFLTLVAEEGANWNEKSLKALLPSTVDLSFNPSVECRSVCVEFQRFLRQLITGLRSSAPDEQLPLSQVAGVPQHPSPLLYIFPAGEQSAALLQLGGHCSLMLDAGFGYRPAAWDYVSHFSRVNWLLLTNVETPNLLAASALLQRKAAVDCKPDIGALFANLPQVGSRAASGEPSLLACPFDAAQSIRESCAALRLTPRAIDTKSSPLTLYDCAGFGRLQLFALHEPPGGADGKQLAQAFAQRNATFYNDSAKSQAAASALLLIWKPDDDGADVIRILYPSCCSEAQVFAGLEKMRARAPFLSQFDHSKASAAAAKPKPRASVTSAHRLASSASTTAKPTTTRPIKTDAKVAAKQAVTAAKMKPVQVAESARPPIEQESSASVVLSGSVNGMQLAAEKVVAIQPENQVSADVVCQPDNHADQSLLDSSDAADLPERFAAAVHIHDSPEVGVGAAGALLESKVEEAAGFDTPDAMDVEGVTATCGGAIESSFPVGAVESSLPPLPTASRTPFGQETLDDAELALFGVAAHSAADNRFGQSDFETDLFGGGGGGGEEERGDPAAFAFDNAAFVEQQVASITSGAGDLVEQRLTAAAAAAAMPTVSVDDGSVFDGIVDDARQQFAHMQSALWTDFREHAPLPSVNYDSPIASDETDMLNRHGQADFESLPGADSDQHRQPAQVDTPPSSANGDTGVRGMVGGEQFASGDNFSAHFTPPVPKAASGAVDADIPNTFDATLVDNGDRAATIDQLKKEWGEPLGLPPKPSKNVAAAAEAKPPQRRAPPAVRLDTSRATKPAVGAVAATKKTTTTMRPPPNRPTTTRTTVPPPPKPTTGASRAPPKTKPKAPPALRAPVYLDVAFVPRDATADFFRLVRARSYVLTGAEHDGALLDAFLTAKASWGDATPSALVPTHDSAPLSLWLAKNEERLAQLGADVKPSAQRASVRFDGADGDACAAYRIEF